jgi:DNA invertase Pin-like site-specific DNA recombinase
MKTQAGGRAMKSAVIYTRVSTDRQAAEGVSLDAQLDRARAWAAAMGYTITGTFSDAGISGKRMDTRPALLAAIEQACREKSAVIVYSLSRLARSTRDALAISERLDKAGADLVSLSEQIDTTTAAGKMVFRMLAVLSEFERDLVSERTRTALTYKRSTGHKTGGTVPFGYTADDHGRLIEHDGEQAAIREIKSLKAKGYTLRAIAVELQRQGITTKTGGAVWAAKVVRGILAA